MVAMPGWEKILEERLPRFGHRNWVVVADAAYPSQSRPGIETIVSGESQQATVEALLTQLRNYSHIRPVIHLDKELEFVCDQDAHGAESFRQWLASALTGLDVHTESHDEIIAKLDRAAQMFSILIIKSTMCIPYTTVFFELDCGYWNANAEAKLRSAIKESQG